MSARIRNVNASAGIDKVIAGGRAAFHGSPINTAIPATVIANTSGPSRTTGYHHQLTRHSSNRRPRSPRPARVQQRRTTDGNQRRNPGPQLTDHPDLRPMARGTQTTHVKIRAASMNTKTSCRRRLLRHPRASGSVMISSWRLSTTLVIHEHNRAGSGRTESDQIGARWDHQPYRA